MDKLGANYENTLSQIQERLGVTPVSITLLLVKNQTFMGVINLLTMRALYWDQDPKE